jgi:hypothetical protein
MNQYTVWTFGTAGYILRFEILAAVTAYCDSLLQCHAVFFSSQVPASGLCLQVEENGDSRFLQNLKPLY